METSREDVGIAIRSAFLKKGAQQRFSLFGLIVLSVAFLFLESIKAKPINYLRSFVKDVIYRGSYAVSLPYKGFDNISNIIKSHFNVYNENITLKNENALLKDQYIDPNFLILENNQLRRLLDEQISSKANFVSARVMLDKQSPYLNSFIINSGSNRNIKNGMAVLHNKNFIGRIVDVNFFSSRVLLVTDLNSKIPVVIEPSGHHAILSGHGQKNPTLEYLPEKHTLEKGNKIFTSGKEGIFSPGIFIGEVEKKANNVVTVSLATELNQITFVNIDLENMDQNK